MHDADEKLRLLIAENIAYYRRQNGQTQAELAEKLRYSDKSVSKWERADGTPDIFILARIAALYDITVQDLLSTKKVAKVHTKRILITILANGLVWLAMTVFFCFAHIFGVLESHAWLLYIYAIPITGIVTDVFSVLWWNQWMQLLSSSVIIWGTGMSLVLSIPLKPLSLLLLICAVLQVLLALFYLLKIQTIYREFKEERRGRKQK
ncbi:MAG: helix-turn-helix domain-containing protein [Oscillospiraceae bacterium]|jgi:transcriptional regulator with XRE-family HTH domain|nr:helix-turn-helix domain-containing protein [Oscillospiraceae bacterium]